MSDSYNLRLGFAHVFRCNVLMKCSCCCVRCRKIGRDGRQGNGNNYHSNAINCACDLSGDEAERQRQEQHKRIRARARPVATARNWELRRSRSRHKGERVGGEEAAKELEDGH